MTTSAPCGRRQSTCRACGHGVGTAMSSHGAGRAVSGALTQHTGLCTRTCQGEFQLAPCVGVTHSVWGSAPLRTPVSARAPSPVLCISLLIESDVTRELPCPEVSHTRQLPKLQMGEGSLSVPLLGCWLVSAAPGGKPPVHRPCLTLSGTCVLLTAAPISSGAKCACDDTLSSELSN